MKKSELVRFEIEGAEMAVRLAGDRGKPALLLIHGFPTFRQVACAPFQKIRSIS